MIRKTLSSTQLATYSIDLPNSKNRGLPTPTGTGFFVSPDVWFITAAHVITEKQGSKGQVRDDINQARLMKEARPGHFVSGMCQAVTFDFIDPEMDLANLKVDFGANSNKDDLKGLQGFPFIEVSSRELEEGEPVYAFGYPLSDPGILLDGPVAFGYYAHCPRVTSAIVASTMDRTKMISTPEDVKIYTLDKALNYGNSGGLIVATDTGKVYAFCSRFQPVRIRQMDYVDQNGNPLYITIPSLYGIVISLANKRILEQLRLRGVTSSNE